MDPIELSRTVADILNIPENEACKLIEDAFCQEDPFGCLSDLLGYSNIELIFEIFKFKDHFTKKDIKNAQVLYLEHTIPASEPVDRSSMLLDTAVLKENAKYFPYSKFNPVQSAVFNSIYNSDGNTLISAPTGAGKTDIALLATLRALRHKNSQISYIVPMKALASEIFTKYSKKFPGQVIEYTGDTDIDYKTASQARIIISTPEKFDSATRRLCCVFKNIKLVIIDEIHLLEDDRGPVIESIVARMFRITELKQSSIRIVGLSATLPNYMDVARFINATHVHFFDKTYRPVPLKMTITGFTQTATPRDEQDYLLEKVREFVKSGKQVLVFVHSRSKTLKTATFLSEKLETRQCIKTNLSGNLHTLVNCGLGIHHAGLSRSDRHQMEQLFSTGKINVLVTTSTLAWGVNLPAYAVIIYGSTFYDAGMGQFTDVSILDVLQIFGRAGRPQFDSSGEAILMTTGNKIDKYVALVKRNTEIESKMLFHVPENLNAEIYLGNITSISTALNWIRNTFLYVRIMKNPAKYGILLEELGLEEQALSQYIYLTVKRLEDCGLINVNKIDLNYNTWTFESSFYGQIASLYYLNHQTVYLWLKEINSVTDELGLVVLLIKSVEFKQITIRKDEISTLANLHQDLLLDRVIDFVFDETVESKLLTLLFSFLHFRKPPIFTLICDTDFLVDNLKRLLEAMKELLIHLNKLEIFTIAFNLEKKISRKRKVKVSNFEVRATRINDDFVEVAIENLQEHASIQVFVDRLTESNNRSRGRKLELLCVFKHPKHIFRCRFPKITLQIHTAEEWKVFEKEISFESDYSLNGLYKYGIHSCDAMFHLSGLRVNCAHISSSTATDKIVTEEMFISSKKETFNNHFNHQFSTSIEFIPVSGNYYRERLKIVTNLIYKMKITDALIVCPTREDANDTQNALKTMQVLDGIQNTVQDSVCSFEEASSILKKFKVVVFKCLGSQSEMFPVYEILKRFDHRKAIVFESPSRIDYLRSVIQE